MNLKEVTQAFKEFQKQSEIYDDFQYRNFIMPVPDLDQQSDTELDEMIGYMVEGLATGLLMIRTYVNQDIRDTSKKVKETELSPIYQRVANFMICDPAIPDPVTSDFHCYGSLKVTPGHSYMLNLDLFLYFPPDFKIEKIIYLMKHEKFAGLPPTLSIDHSRDGTWSYCLKFTGGSGYGGVTPEVMKGLIIEKMKALEGIIAIWYNLSDEWNDNVVFKDLEQALIHGFNAT